MLNVTSIASYRSLLKLFLNIPVWSSARRNVHAKTLLLCLLISYLGMRFIFYSIVAFGLIFMRKLPIGNNHLFIYRIVMIFYLVYFYATVLS